MFLSGAKVGLFFVTNKYFCVFFSILTKITISFYSVFSGKVMVL